MQNTITFDVSGDCACACVSCIYDGVSNYVKFVYELREFTAPQIELTQGETTTVVDLEIVDNTVVYDFPVELFDVNPLIKFRFLDVGKIGTQFYFYGHFGGNTPRNQTMYVYRPPADPLRFYLQFKNVYPIITNYSDDFEITDDGELQLKEKEVAKINVTETDGKITNVSIIFDDETTSSNNCEYDAEGNLIKFGNLPIDWSV